jgi:hypothetical protein
MKFPDLLNIFPVNLRRELRDKSLRHSGFFALKPASDGSKSQNSLLAGNLRGDGCDQHCIASKLRIVDCFVKKKVAETKQEDRKTSALATPG